MTTWWRRRYGSSPLHLLALIACFALSAYAALQVSGNPAVVRIGLWFLGAVIAHDLVLFPLYALADRCLTGLRGRRPATPARGTVNYLRVPALLSGLLLLVFCPLILRRGDGPYGAASDLDQAPYLRHWLLIAAALFLGSAVVLAVRTGRRAATDGLRRSGSEAAGLENPSRAQRSTARTRRDA